MANRIIRFPIGDWSEDGHSQCDWFDVNSNKDVESLREAHFKAKEVIGFDIGDMCSNYGSPYLSEDQIELLISAGIDTGINSGADEDARYIDSNHLMDIWLKCLMKCDPELELEIVPVKSTTINFYGFDSKNRHLDTPGYGCFD